MLLKTFPVTSMMRAIVFQDRMMTKIYIVRKNDCISQLAKRLIVTLTGINNIETIQFSDLVFKTCMDVSTK